MHSGAILMFIWPGCSCLGSYFTGANSVHKWRPQSAEQRGNRDQPRQMPADRDITVSTLGDNVELIRVFRAVKSFETNFPVNWLKKKLIHRIRVHISEAEYYEVGSCTDETFQLLLTLSCLVAHEPTGQGVHCGVNLSFQDGSSQTSEANLSFSAHSSDM
jgi:hypothetical protein